MVFQILEFSKLKDNKAMSWQSFYAWWPFWKKITKNPKITNNKDLPGTSLTNFSKKSGRETRYFCYLA